MSLPKSIIERCETEMEQMLVRCLEQSNMLLETYAEDTDSQKKTLVIKDMIGINQNLIMQACNII